MDMFTFYFNRTGEIWHSYSKNVILDFLKEIMVYDRDGHISDLVFLALILNNLAAGLCTSIFLLENV